MDIRYRESLQRLYRDRFGIHLHAVALCVGTLCGAAYGTTAQGEVGGDYTKVTYLHAKGEQIRYDASRCYSQAFLPLLCGAALRAPIWEGGNPIDQRSR